MIVRILNGGQYEVADDMMEELNRLDDPLSRAIDNADEDAFRSGLTQLLSAVQQRGKILPDDYLGPSDVVLPAEGASMEDVKGLLTEEGLIPGI